MPEGDPSAMVVLASEQLWPNLQGLVCWKALDPGLRHLKIYATSDEHRSQIPARRLEQFSRSHFPDISVERSSEPSGMSPADVQRKIEDWIRSLPSHRWIINATGGNKLMTCGAVALAGRAGVQVIYREIGSDEWFELNRSEPHGPLEPHWIRLPAEAMDRIPVDKLVQSLWIVPEGCRFSSETVETLPLVEITQGLIRTGADWKEAFHSATGAPPREQPGFLFERYVGAALREMGLRNVALNVTATSLEGKNLQEVDLVVHHDGRLTILDCKLRSRSEEGVRTEPVVRQIRTAEASRHQLGVAGAQVVMIRPGRRFDETERALAEALRVKVIDQGDAPRLFTHLASVFGRDGLPDRLVEAERLLARRAFVLTRSVTGEPARPADWGQGMVLFDELIGQQRWAAWVLGGKGYLACVKPAGDSDFEERFIYRVIQILSPFGKASLFHKSSELFQFKIKPSSREALKSLSRHLETFIGRDFLREDLRTPGGGPVGETGGRP